MEKEFILFTSKLFALQAENEDRFECELLFIYLQKNIIPRTNQPWKMLEHSQKSEAINTFFWSSLLD